MSETVTSGRLLRIREVAERLAVSERTVERLIARRELPAVKLGRARTSPIRVDERELEQWVYGPGVPVEYRGGAV